MTSKNVKFSQYLKNLEQKSKREFIAQRVLERMKELCKECMKDRISCALEPHCPDRQYLNILIELGEPSKEFPKFCYEQYLLTIHRFLNKKITIGEPVDANVPWDSFYEILLKRKGTMNKFRLDADRKLIQKSLLELFKRYAKHVNLVSYNQNILILVDGAFYRLSLDKKIMKVNLKKTTIENGEELQVMLDLLSKYHKLKYSLDPQFNGWFYVSISIPKDNIPKETLNAEFTKLKPQLEGLTDYIHFDSSDKSHELIIDVKTTDSKIPGKKTTYQDLMKMMDTIQTTISEITSKKD